MADGYGIDFSAASAAEKELQSIIEDLGTQLKKLDSIQNELLNDSYWQGTSKMNFKKVADEYRQQVQQLYVSAQEHDQALVKNLNDYAQAEG